MSIAGNQLSTPALPSQWLAPDDRGRPYRTEDYERGGVALSDPSQGLDTYTWRARLVGDEVRVARDPFDDEVVLFTGANITEVTLCFDQNMRPLVAFVQNGRAKLRWFDSSVGGIVVTDLDVGVRSPYLTLDDKRAEVTSSSDAILFYIIGNRLCFRQQRERFLVEHTLKWFVGNAVTIRRAGMSTGLRVQFELIGLTSRALARPYLSSWRPTASLLSASSIGVVAPADVDAGDLLYVAIVHRSALTVPTGWTLRASQACSNGTSQTLSVLSKDSAAPSDAGATFTFTCASADYLAGGSFCVRGEAEGVALLAAAQGSVASTATNSIAAPTSNAALLAGEVHVLLATSINAQGITTMPSMPAGTVLISGSGPNMRLAFGYQLRDLGQSISGSVAFDNGTPTSNGLAAITLRFGVPP